MPEIFKNPALFEISVSPLLITEPAMFNPFAPDSFAIYKSLIVFTEPPSAIVKPVPFSLFTIDIF